MERIVEETDWEPPQKGIPDDAVVGVRVDDEEKDLQDRMRKVGGDS